MRTKKQKLIEYEENYGDIPKDYISRLNYLYNKLGIDDAKSDEILKTREAFINSTYYKTIRIILYEVPEFTPRPRARMIHKANIINAATGGNEFIQVYSITGRQNREYMRMYTRENLQELQQLLCTPCNIEYKTYFPTPKYYNKVDTFMAEIGLYRPISKPDFDNIEKCYSDSFTGNVWIDDIVVVDASFHKFYSILPRVEINLHYANQLYNAHQYRSMVRRRDFTEDMQVQYFGGK